MPKTPILQHIQDVTDVKGNAHSILIYGKGNLHFGNLTFETMKDVKAHLDDQYGLPKPGWCQCGENETFGFYPEDGECKCGVYKHHVHCGTCGMISQVG